MGISWHRKYHWKKVYSYRLPWKNKLKTTFLNETCWWAEVNTHGYLIIGIPYFWRKTQHTNYDRLCIAVQLLLHVHYPCILTTITVYSTLKNSWIIRVKEKISYWNLSGGERTWVHDNIFCVPSKLPTDTVSMSAKSAYITVQGSW